MNDILARLRAHDSHFLRDAAVEPIELRKQMSATIAAPARRSTRHHLPSHSSPAGSFYGHGARGLQEPSVELGGARSNSPTRSGRDGAAGLSRGAEGDGAKAGFIFGEWGDCVAFECCRGHAVEGILREC